MAKTVMKSKTPKPLRAKLVTAALKEIRSGGAHKLSLRKVAEVAGCTPMATYRHFASKEALIAEIAREGFIHLKSEMTEAMKAHPENALMQIESAGQRYIHMAMSRSEHLLMMFGGFIKDHDQFKELKTAGDAAFFSLVDLMKYCQQQKVLPVSDPIKQAVSAWSIVHGFSMLLINGNLEFLGINLKNCEDQAKFVSKAILQGLENQKE
ncbi:MAG: TetR/AcrR family transcriptional regulator [Pseudobdellovibrionaceae bacterium]|jgi:AcrR family transcriptional regulator